ncbi:hypothetical protein [Streptomyces sp. NPDC001970]
MTAPQIRAEVRGTDIDLDSYYGSRSTPFDAEGERLVTVDAVPGRSLTCGPGLCGASSQ